MKTNIEFSKSNEVVLRPRFQLEIPKSKGEVIAFFENYDAKNNQLIIKRVNDHIFIRLASELQHLWTPQLDLEVNKTEENTCRIYGLYGPKPSVWLFFMFLHAIVAVGFIAFGVWAYSNFTLNMQYQTPLLLMLLMVVLWFMFYGFGRAGKAKGKEEMKILHQFMQKILNDI